MEMKVWIWKNKKGISASEKPDRMHDTEYVPAARLLAAEEKLAEAKFEYENVCKFADDFQDRLTASQEQCRLLKEALEKSACWCHEISAGFDSPRKCKRCEVLALTKQVNK